MKLIIVISLLVLLISCYLPDSYGDQGRDYQFKYTGYVAPSLDLFLREYNAFGKSANEFELDQKLLLLLDNPDCWYNQRGKKVILLFNETNFPEEYAILRSSSKIFGPNNKLENDFLVLEEEEERQNYMGFYDQMGDTYNSEISENTSIYKKIMSDEEDKNSYLDSYSENKIPIIKDMMSEDLEKEKYKSRIRRLINMKENTLKRIYQTSIEIKNLESSFIMQCDSPECNICNDFQSHLNSKYIELNKYKHRYKMIISLFKEFVDHSNKFDFYHNYDKNNSEWQLNSGVNYTQAWEDFNKKRGRIYKVIKRPNFNITKDDHRVDHESNYKELKKMLSESEKEIDIQIKNSEKDKIPGNNERAESNMTDCTKEKLEELVNKNEKLSLLIRSVKFFIESLFERSCPKCNIKSFNGFTKFGDMLDTQIRILKYYQSQKIKFENDIQSCIYFLENKNIELDDHSQSIKRPYGYKYRYMPPNEYNRKLNKIFKKYEEYEKNKVDLEKLIYGSTKNWEVHNKKLLCDVNSLVLMSELSKEMISRIISSEIQKRVYLRRKECQTCSYNDCQRCYENYKKLKNLESNINSQNKLYKSILAYLDLCGFEQILISSEFKDLNKNNEIELEYFGKDGRLWSVEKYLSESFINRVLGLDGQLSPFLRAKVLERIKFTLQAFIKVLELSYSNIDRKDCSSCKNRQCNDCYYKFKKIIDNNTQIRKYNNLLRLVNFELNKYFVQIRKTNVKRLTRGNTKEWILIKDNTLREWLPNQPELILKCDKESYTEAFTFYKEISFKRKHLQDMSEHIYNSIINSNLKFSEYHFSKQVKEWGSIWKEKTYYDEVFSNIDRYLSSCVNKNQEFNSSFHDYLNRKSEIKNLYKSFQEHSENINCLIEKLREIHSKGYIECSRAFQIDCCSNLTSSEDIYQRLNSEFKTFKRIRKKLNSYIYNEQLNYYDYNKEIYENYHRNEFKDRFSKYLSMRPEKTRIKKRIKEDKLDKTIFEYQDITKSPIPGMSKYLHGSKSSTGNEDQNTFQLNPESEFQCSKIEILVLQKIASLLSKNQTRLKLLMGLNSIRCEIEECYNCKVRSKFHDKIERELNILNKVLNTATEQLNQCMLDSSENLITKEDIIEFQSTLIQLSKKESSFNVDLKSYIYKIKDFQCEKKEIEKILDIKQEKSIKIYFWIEEMLTQIQTSNDEDENINNNYTIWTHQVIQLLNFSMVLEERLQECINTLNICIDHSEENDTE
ncbi:uncharacterized protein cubi_00393 [Cryptosporidium ubiquitum]|uniref:Uncharacterized protein n=1 Tax=Cryptosporidium ubiquitum TaxID=857276 RepID=A0A1J4MDU5_9CRYT|nr:uncharacterized protein cubi_00393 [Cryptosporidium ubiquitum]OII72398.1 hypothetical protein cubi_00393 [Cryptosporidium ubiquitum]